MSLLAFKLLLPPILILLASLAGRRWGDAIGGWLVGLPLTSGPVAAFLALQHGPQFAALATNGSLVGTAAQACFCMGYALLAERGWQIAVVGGILAFGAGAGLLQIAQLSHLVLFLLALAALILGAQIIPHRHALRSSVVAPWWDLPARMVVATTLVVTLTAAAAFVGAQVAGVLAAFPIFAATLAIFAHRMKGPAMATQVLRGMVFALFGFAVFFYVLGPMLTGIGLIPAFLAATLCSLLVQGLSLRLVRRQARPIME
jgi:hypothetical protein